MFDFQNKKIFGNLVCNFKSRAKAVISIYISHSTLTLFNVGLSLPSLDRDFILLLLVILYNSMLQFYFDRAFEGLSNLTSLRMSDCNLTNFPEQAFTPLINLRTLELRRWKQLKRLADFSFRW